MLGVQPHHLPLPEVITHLYCRSSLNVQTALYTSGCGCQEFFYKSGAFFYRLYIQVIRVGPALWMCLRPVAAWARIIRVFSRRATRSRQLRCTYCDNHNRQTGSLELSKSFRMCSIYSRINEILSVGSVLRKEVQLKAQES